MQNLSKSLAAILAVAMIAGLGPVAAWGQSVMERPRTIRADICPAPELVNAHIVLDPAHPRETYTGPIMRAPGALNLPGVEASDAPTVVPVEPQSTDDVLTDFRQDYGLNVPAVEFLFASVAPAGGIICHYRSDVVAPVIAIRTNSTTCNVSQTGAWTAAGTSIQRCDGGRRTCTFRCTD